MASVAPKMDSAQMREEIQRQLIKNSDKFWKNMAELKPKEWIDAYIKILPYGFAKVPEEKPIGDDERGRLILEETKRKATIIGAGLPRIEETPIEEDE